MMPGPSFFSFDNAVFWSWVVLGLACAGTYAWRGLGVMLSGKISQESLFFKWLTCVTYAMVASLVVRIVVLPVGVLAQLPLMYRLAATIAALAVMVSGPQRMVAALLTGTLLTALLGWLG